MGAAAGGGEGGRPLAGRAYVSSPHGGAFAGRHASSASAAFAACSLAQSSRSQPFAIVALTTFPTDSAKRAAGSQVDVSVASRLSRSWHAAGQPRVGRAAMSRKNLVYCASPAIALGIIPSGDT